MTILLRVLLALCSLTTAAHFLRFGTVWEAAPVLTIALAAGLPGLLPRPALVLAALAGAMLWADQTVTLATWRMSMGLPWVRLVLILGTVCLVHLGVTLLLLGQTGRRIFGPLSGTVWVRTAVMLLIGATLVLARENTPLPLLLGERFFPDSGPLWIWAFSVYGGLVAGWLLSTSSATTRGRIWALFSAAFFGQLLLGLAGWSVFLMTGKLHLPVPALILAGPLFRGDGFFMPILLGVSLLLVGPAWCSHLCYIGAWDDRLARLKTERPGSLPTWAPRLRAALLAVTVFLPLALRLLGVSWMPALILAALFGLAGVALMVLWSAGSGIMTHCTVWCPIGLVNNLLGRILPWSVRIDAGCTGCGLCAKVCRYNALTKADLKQKKTGRSCSLCGDCLARCPHGHLVYFFPGLSATRSRQLFVTLVASLHAVFLAVARI